MKIKFFIKNKLEKYPQIVNFLLKNERLGDHKWWISNTKAFKRDYPRWKQSYNQKQIIKELYENYKNHL